MSSTLRDRIVVVTGAGSGIGRASALAFARAGAVVLASDMNEHTAGETAQMARRAGGRAVANRADVTDAMEVAGLVRAAVSQFGQLDVFFANAGGQTPKPTLDTTPEDFRRTVELNLHSVYYAVHAALPVMLERRRGVILATTSGAGLNAVPGLIAYGAAKAGIISLVRNIAVEFGARGIRANAIAPGAMDTPPLRGYIGTLPGGADGYIGEMPAGRLGTPEEIAQVAVFLAGDEASYVNGTCLPVDGGTSALLAQPSGRPAPGQ